LQAQSGILTPPKQHSLIQIYNFDSLPLIAMNVVRIGAQIPGMVCELESEFFNDRPKNNLKGSEVSALVGFGPLLWILITPDAPARGGFRSLEETDIDDTEVPESEGDMFLYFSSENKDFNRILADEIKELFGPSGNLIEELVLKDGTHFDIAGQKEKVLLDSSGNLDTVQSSFVLTQKFISEAKFSYEIPQHKFLYKMGSELGAYTVTFSKDPQKLSDYADEVPHPAVSRWIFFIPSLDLLTSLRMGGIRMGSLAINAKWKE
jgi:deferrochelatase/peroxidase EfeB